MSTPPRIEVIKGDITKVEADAIVNAANTSLLGGGGVDGAIHRAGGSEILADCRKIVARQGGCRTGQSVITTAGKLKAKYIIHTVGPVWNGGHRGEKGLLASCYKTAIQLALSHNCKTIAFPAISTGVYRYPIQEAADVAVKTVTEFLRTHTEIVQVMFVCFDDDNYEAIAQTLKASKIEYLG